MLSTSTTLCHCLEKVANHKTREIVYQKICLSPRPPPKVLSEVFGEFSTKALGNLLRMIVPEVDLRFQGAPLEELQQEE